MIFLHLTHCLYQQKAHNRSDLHRRVLEGHPRAMSLTLFDCNVVQLTEYLPQSGPSTAPFIDPILRNGVDDVNLLNASIFYLEHRWKSSLPSASDFDRELCKEARSFWQLCVGRNMPVFVEFIQSCPTRHLSRKQKVTLL